MRHLPLLALLPSLALAQTGAPFITATLLCDGGKPRVALTQQRYVRLGSKAPDAQSWK
ncbi:hypothetical protein HMI49_41685, partial [Corallococcus exercitus]|nr:hypothetical protein [Corallococcus exercitus]